jgi:hypothetical protein
MALVAIRNTAPTTAERVPLLGAWGAVPVLVLVVLSGVVSGVLDVVESFVRSRMGELLGSEIPRP